MKDTSKYTNCNRRMKCSYSTTYNVQPVPGYIVRYRPYRTVLLVCWCLVQNVVRSVIIIKSKSPRTTNTATVQLHARKY